MTIDHQVQEKADVTLGDQIREMVSCRETGFSLSKRAQREMDGHRIDWQDVIHTLKKFTRSENDFNVKSRARRLIARALDDDRDISVVVVVYEGEKKIKIVATWAE